jgi:hypothetical protein
VDTVEGHVSRRSWQKLPDLASKKWSNKGKTQPESRRHAGTTFTPSTPEKNVLPKRKKKRRKQTKTQKLQSPNNYSEKVNHHWNQARGKEQISTGSNQGDKTKTSLAQRLGGRQTKNKPGGGRLGVFLPQKNWLTEGSLSS